MNEIVILNSGSKLELGMAPFVVGMRLFKTVANELKVVDVQLNLEDMNLRKLADKDINTFKNAILQLVGSDALEASLFECMKRCLYNGEAINVKTFEPEDARADYLPVAWEVMKYNLAPFFRNLNLSSDKPSATPAPSPQST